MDASGAIPTEAVRSILKNQYHAALAMLREGIECCPDDLWAGDAYPLAYWRWCDERVDTAVDELDLAAPDSGFPWYRMSKLEHQLVNLRHLQHHGAQIADRLRTEADLGVRWVGGSRPR